MRETGQDVWWRRTSRLAVATIGGLTVLAFAALLLTPAVADRTFLGMPLAYFLFALALPLFILIAAFWFAHRQLALDHRFDVTGSQT